MTHQICREIFEDAHTLESLEISGLTEIQEAMEGDLEEHVFPLPSLQKLVLDDVPAEVAMVVFNGCACPSLCSLSMGRIDDDLIEAFFVESLDRFVCHSPLILPLT